MKFNLILNNAKILILIINIIALTITLIINKKSAFLLLGYSFKLELVLVGLLLGYISYFFLNVTILSLPKYITLIMLCINIIHLVFMILVSIKIFLSTHSIVFDGGWIKLIRLEWSQSELYQLSIEILRKLDLVLSYQEIWHVIENSSNPEELETNFLKVKKLIVDANLQNSKMQNTQPNSFLLKLGMMIGLGRSITPSEFSSFISISLSLLTLLYGPAAYMLFGKSVAVNEQNSKEIMLQLQNHDEKIKDIEAHFEGFNTINNANNTKLATIATKIGDLEQAKIGQRDTIQCIHSILDAHRIEDKKILDLLMMTITSTLYISDANWSWMHETNPHSRTLEEVSGQYSAALDILTSSKKSVKRLLNRYSDS